MSNCRGKVNPRQFTDTCLASSSKLQGEAKPRPFTETCSVYFPKLQAHSERQSEQQGVNQNTANPSSWELQKQKMLENTPFGAFWTEDTAGRPV